MENQIVTVFSDASYASGKAGWAFWAKHQGETLRVSRGITFRVDSISDAETIALCTAIMRSVEHFNLRDAIVVAQSDSTDALGSLLYAGWANGKNQFFRVAKNTDVRPQIPKKVNSIRATFCKRVLDLVAERNITVYLKHVRAHTGKDNARSHVNAWCDQEAKKRMRAVVLYDGEATQVQS